MESYILKNTNESEKVLLYQEQSGYTFSPKSATYRVKRITVLNNKMVESILKSKIVSKYKRLIQIIYSLINSDDTTSGDVLVTYTEIDRLKQILIYKYSKYLDKEFIKKYLKKLQVLEMELKKVHVMELQQELNYEEENNRGR